MSIVFAILLFSILIFVHELGHFLAAKASKVQVNEFSMFMGPAIFKKQVGETLYSIRCIPIGGYCAMEGEDSDTDNPRSFQKAAWWKRLIILVAGSFMNLLIGFILVVTVLSFTVQTIPQIESLRTGSTLAQEGGIVPGDIILEIDGQAVETTDDFSRILDQDKTKTVFSVLVQRNGKELFLEKVEMVPKNFPENEEGAAGLYYGLTWATRPLTFPEVLSYSVDRSIFFIEQVWVSLGMLITGQVGVTDMSGPVGIVDMMSQMASAAPTQLDALLNMLYFGSFIALNLAVMNLLPIPALDGGRVVALLLTTGIEKITRKKIDPKYEGYIHAAGMVLLLILMAVIMFKDIFTIVKG